MKTSKCRLEAVNEKPTMKKEIITLELKVKIEYETAKTRDYLIRRLPEEIDHLHIEGGGVDGRYAMILQSAEIKPL